MKKHHLALASLVALTSTAHAQSSVTLYGIIDEGFNINTNSGGKHLYNLSSGVMQGSRWGLRGAEDLGGGAKAIFVLENGFRREHRRSRSGRSDVRPSGIRWPEVGQVRIGHDGSSI